MSSTNDGGPAFPMPSGDEPRVDKTTHYNEGMSLRDYFAGQALAAIIAHSELCDDEGNWNVGPAPGTPAITNMACFAYTAADAMLAEREVKP